MTDCDELISELRGQAQDHARLAVMAATVPVIEMHIDLALFNAERAQAAEEFCEDD